MKNIRVTHNEKHYKLTPICPNTVKDVVFIAMFYLNRSKDKDEYEYLYNIKNYAFKYCEFSDLSITIKDKINETSVKKALRANKDFFAVGQGEYKPNSFGGPHCPSVVCDVYRIKNQNKYIKYMIERGLFIETLDFFGTRIVRQLDEKFTKEINKLVKQYKLDNVEKTIIIKRFKELLELDLELNEKYECNCCGCSGYRSDHCTKFIED
ncbi:MAG TPA: hypothetical protein VMX17_12600 [Candidatus Glassbacteria bacterium]|nr:hypothetical protein [Candidatus Glassbacteria bacterium]